MTGLTLPRFYPIQTGYTTPENARASDQRETLARRATYAPRLPWDVFAKRLGWEYGEHVAIIGPTGSGKTVLLDHLLPLHKYVVVFATKPRDDSMDKLINSHGYLRMSEWESLDPDQFPRRVLWPDAKTLHAPQIQQRVFGDALERIYLENGWTVGIDEGWYFSNVLKLDGYIKMYLLQARSLGISLLYSAQRPAWIPREIYTSATHLFFYRVNDETDLKSIAGIGWKDSRVIQDLVANLERYQFLYVNSRTGEMYRSRSPKPR